MVQEYFRTIRAVLYPERVSAVGGEELAFEELQHHPYPLLNEEGVGVLTSTSLRELFPSDKMGYHSWFAKIAAYEYSTSTRVARSKVDDWTGDNRSPAGGYVT